jgi:hypothetical protein
MIPAVNLSHDVSQGLRASAAARTTCDVHAKALQDLADELPICAAADQHRKALPMVAMQKIQHPTMPEGQENGRAPLPRPLLEMLLDVCRAQGAKEEA